MSVWFFALKVTSLNVLHHRTSHFRLRYLPLELYRTGSSTLSLPFTADMHTEMCKVPCTFTVKVAVIMSPSSGMELVDK